MKKIFAIISLAALMMPVSCMKDELAGLDNNGAADKAMTFKAVMETPGTKTTISIDGNQGTVAWAAGDDLKFDYEIGKVDSEPVFSSALAEGDIKDGVATFKAEVPEVFGMTEAEYKETLEEGATNSRHMYVAYPSAVETTYETSGYTVTIPTVQDGTFANASIALAKWNPSKPNDPLQFRNLCGLIQVTVSENVRQIKLTSSEYIAGKANVGFEDIYVPYVKNMIEADASKVITVDVTEAGTYYIAVKPGTIKDLYIEYLDADGDGVCDKLAKGDVTAERAHILPLGGFADGSFAAAGGFFVKPDGTGDGDGSSWDNAANYETFRAKLAKTVNDESAVVYMAAGTYIVTSVANVSATGKNYQIFGGYPSDAKGYSLAGRDVENNPTVLMSDGSSHRIWNFKYGTYVVDGIHFEDVSYSDGGALNIQLSTNITCRNCVFKNCSATKNSGAIAFAALTSTGSVVENCVFSGNSADGTATDGGFGGAVGAFGTAGETAGLVTFRNCLFEDNEAKFSGGAVASRITSMRFVDCNFIDNIATSVDDDRRASVFYTDASKVDTHVYFDGCYLANSKTLPGEGRGCMVLNYSNRTTMCINNSVVSGYWGYGNSHTISNLNSGKLVVANSTLIGQAGSIVYSSNEAASTSVINSIVGNASTSMYSCRSYAGTIDVRSSLCTVTMADITEVTDEETGAVTEIKGVVTGSDNATNINLRTNAAADVKFPTDNSPWVTGSAGTQRSNNGTKSTNVSDCRGKVYYYDWDGTYPTGVTFTPTTISNVTSLVTAADADFGAWLTANGSFAKDIRGAQRQDPIWPGSYQE